MIDYQLLYVVFRMIDKPIRKLCLTIYEIDVSLKNVFEKIECQSDYGFFTTKHYYIKLIK